MMTDRFSTLASTAFDLDAVYLNWQPVGMGPDGLSYLATRQSANQAVELRVVQPIAKDVALVDRFRRRASLIDLCATALIRRVLEIRIDERLPLVVVERPCLDAQGDFLLSELLAGERDADRLGIARELVAALRVAHRIGLQHGHLDANAVIVGHEGHIHIDFTLLNVTGDGQATDATWTFSSASERTEFDDLIDLRLLLRQLLGK